MLSFSYQVGWKIKQLLKHLNNNNLIESLQEIDILLNMNGDENRMLLISSLLDGIDFKEIRLTNSSRDPNKVSPNKLS